MATIPNFAAPHHDHVVDNPLHGGGEDPALSDISDHTDMGDEMNALGAQIQGFDHHNLAAAAEEEDPELPPANAGHGEEEDFGFFDEVEEEGAMPPHLLPQQINNLNQIEHLSEGATSSEENSFG